MENKNLATLIPDVDSKNVNSTLEKISKPLTEFVRYNNLPIENVVTSNKEICNLFMIFSSAIDLLDIEDREKSEYLSKFVLSSAVGLFDGALNYLWNEIIKSLREKIANYDLVYFYSIAEQINKNYRNLRTEEDLQYISDHDFLEIIRRIGLIDDVSFRSLDNINYLRNKASAAHPNNNGLTGIKLGSLLEDGIKYAILCKPNSSMITIKKLFNNIISIEIPDDDFDVISEDLKKLNEDPLNDFAKSIFGVYCDLKTEKFVLNNIIEISRRIWPSLTESTKYSIGAKYGYYRVNGDIVQKTRTNDYLEAVDGVNYKDSDSIASELIELLNQLKSVHFGINNFYNEFGYARDIEKLIPKTGIPISAKKLLVKTICLCLAGNGNGYLEGVDKNAAIIYEKLVDNFRNEEIKYLISLFSDSEFTSEFYKEKPDKRIREICKKLLDKTSNSDLKSGLHMIIDYPESGLANLYLDRNYQNLVSKIKDDIKI